MIGFVERLGRFVSQVAQASQAGLANPRPDDRARGVRVPSGRAQPPLAEYNTYDARNLFSHLLERVREGEQIVIARHGNPIAKLVPYEGEARRPGFIRTHVAIHDVRRDN